MKEKIKVNRNCVNAKIQAHILSEPEMRKIGFTDHAKDNWYFCRMLRFPKKKLYRDFEISFSVTIPKNGDDIRIDVLDEAFLQPYDYQRILSDHPDHETALIVQEQVDGLFTGRRCAFGTYPRRIYLILLLYEKYRSRIFRVRKDIFHIFL